MFLQWPGFSLHANPSSCKPQFLWLAWEGRAGHCAGHAAVPVCICVGSAVLTLWQRVIAWLSGCLSGFQFFRAALYFAE